MSDSLFNCFSTTFRSACPTCPTHLLTHIIWYIIAPHAVISANEYILVETSIFESNQTVALRGAGKANPKEKRRDGRVFAKEKREENVGASARKAKPVIRLAEAAYKLPLSDTCD